MRVVRKRGQEAIEPDVSGVWHLEAEHLWIVTGSEAELDILRSRLSGTAQLVANGVLELNFGNAVGSYGLGSLGGFEVTSRKCSSTDFLTMLRKVSEVATSLPYSTGIGGAVAFNRALAEEEDLLYHAFVYLRCLLGTKSAPSQELLGPLHSILAKPHTRSARVGRVVPVGLARRVDPPVLTQLTSGRFPLCRANHLKLSERTHGLIPEFVEESVMCANPDTPENRFVLSFLDLCLGVVNRVRLAADDQRGEERLLDDCAHMASRLTRVMGHPFWKSVGRLDSFPSSSTTLQRRSDYRAVFGFYNRLRMCTALPLNHKDWIDLLAAKDIALVYELWSYFAVVESVREVIGPPSRSFVVSATPFEASLARGMRVEWGDGTTVSYNPSYSRSAPAARRSYSVLLRPDIVLHVSSGRHAGEHVFDAKFKLDAADWLSDDEDREGMHGKAVRSDIYKMHTYRDALPGVLSAWVLYPGTQFLYYSRSGGCDVHSLGAEETIVGVGSVPLPTSSNGDALPHLVRALLSCSSQGAREAMLFSSAEVRTDSGLTGNTR